MNTKKNKNSKLTKKLIPTNDVFVQFSEEELGELGLKPGDKFSVYHQNDGSILLEKFATMEIDLDELPRETLETLINLSCEQDKSINDIINDLLTEFLISQGYDPYSDFEEEEDGTKEVEEFMDGMACLPAPLYSRIDQIVQEYRVLQEFEEPNLNNLAQFLSITYGVPFPENEVHAVIELLNEPEIIEGHTTSFNFHQKIEQILSYVKKFSNDFGRDPSTTNVVNSLRSIGVNVYENQVKAILDMNQRLH